MENIKSNRRRSGFSRATATKIFTLLLVICLAESATEQRINSRGSKSSDIVAKVNGWRSQRGGSCLSYGHSCWGAHGKRSGRPPVSAPDWYLTRMLRRIASNSELAHPQPIDSRNDVAIYQVDTPNDSSAADKLNVDNENIIVDSTASRNVEAKPMLDDELLAKIKLWQMMRDATDDK
ncbi:neuropeptide CCHamide-1 [Achroia grisella]|uniref:neuropeptide CCHamide-1 n=1 Tax=Achroia grisella TaxID=688607 RepID=UPI0027D2C0C4|nr:neuropeptide CCHamide-1 [Achroia grisella]